MNRRPDPLDADERALAGLLAGQAVPGPSPQLDARILAAARAAARPAMRPTRRRWIAGVGIAASMLLAVGIAWRLRPLPPRPMASEAPLAASVSETLHADASPNAVPSAPAHGEQAAQRSPIAEPAPVAAEKRAARAAAPPAEPAVVFDAPAPMDAAAPSAFPTQSPPPPPPAPPAAVKPLPAAWAANAATQPAKAQAAAAPLQGAFESARQREDARTLDRIETTGSRLDAAAAADAAASGAALPSRAELDEEPPATADSPLVQDAWLQRIRELLAAGESEAARNSLAEFRRRYPAYALPEDLRHLAKP